LQGAKITLLRKAPFNWSKNTSSRLYFWRKELPSHDFQLLRLQIMQAGYNVGTGVHFAFAVLGSINKFKTTFTPEVVRVFISCSSAEP
jgi:hypothetical protein